MKGKLLNVISKTTRYLDPQLQLNIFPGQRGKPGVWREEAYQLPGDFFASWTHPSLLGIIRNQHLISSKKPYFLLIHKKLLVLCNL